MGSDAGFTPGPDKGDGSLKRTFGRRALKAGGVGLAAVLSLAGLSFCTDEAPPVHFQPGDATALYNEASAGGAAGSIALQAPVDPYTSYLMLNVVLNSKPFGQFYHTQRVWTDITQYGWTPEKATERYLWRFRKTVEDKDSRAKRKPLKQVPLSAKQANMLREMLTRDLIRLFEISSLLSKGQPTPGQIADRFVAAAGLSSGSPEAARLRRAVIAFETLKPDVEDAVRFAGKNIWGIYPDPVRPFDEYADLLRRMVSTYQSGPSRIDSSSALNIALADIDALVAKDRNMRDGLVIDKKHPHYQMTMWTFGNELRLSLCDPPTRSILEEYSYLFKRRDNLRAAMGPLTGRMEAFEAAPKP